jgi:hypothetical protein
MITVFGWFTVELSNERPKELICHSCHMKGQVNVSRHVKLAQLFYIPLFPLRIIDDFQCVSCESSLTFGEMGSELKSHYKDFKLKRFPRFWHFTGVLLVLMFWLFSVYKSAEEQIVILERLSDLSVGRVIEYQMEDNNYSSMKVCGIDKSSELVNVVYNSVQVDNLDRIDKILFPNYYSKDTLQLTMETILELGENGKIKSVHW